MIITQARRVGVLLALGLEVGEVDVAVGVALRHHDLQARHLRARRVGAVRRFGDQADVALRVAARRVPGADREQAGVFALRAGVGLQADAGVAGRLAEPRLELARAARRSRRAARRGANGWMLRELGPGDRDHLAGRVQLHRARAERDHRAVEREVLVGEAAQVAQHLGLAVVAVEDRMGQERRCVRAQRVGDQRRDAALEVGERRAAACAVAARTRARAASTSARVVVSSSVMPSIVSPHSGQRRRFMPASRRGVAASRRSRRRCRPSSVSKALSLRTRAAEPPQALRRASRCSAATRSRDPLAGPAGPW